MGSVDLIDRPHARDGDLWRRVADGDADARDLVIERHVGLARMLAHRYARTSEPLEDLEQVACLGLVHAVDRFDPDRGTAFSTFAVPTILGELRRYFRDRTWALRVPRDVRDAAMSVERATDDLTTELGRSPSVAEIARATGLSAEKVLEAREAALAYRCESLDRPLRADAENGAATLGDRIGGGGDEELRRTEASIFVDQLVATALEGRDREVLRLRFREDLLQREIAARIGVSQMQVSRILRDSVRRLRVAAE